MTPDAPLVPEPAGKAAPPQGKVRGFEVPKPAFEFFVMAMHLLSEMGPQPASIVAASAQEFTRELRDAVQRRDVEGVIKNATGVTAVALALFLSVTPHYLEDGGPPDEEEAPTQAEGAQGTVLTEE